MRRRADDRVDVVVDDFNRSESFVQLPVVLRPNVVVFESIRVASSAMITTLALGSRFQTKNKRMIVLHNSFENRRNAENSSYPLVYI